MRRIICDPCYTAEFGYRALVSSLDTANDVHATAERAALHTSNGHGPGIVDAVPPAATGSVAAAPSFALPTAAQPAASTAAPERKRVDQNTKPDSRTTRQQAGKLHAVLSKKNKVELVKLVFQMFEPEVVKQLSKSLLAERDGFVKSEHFIFGGDEEPLQCQRP